MPGTRTVLTLGGQAPQDPPMRRLSIAVPLIASTMLGAGCNNTDPDPVTITDDGSVDAAEFVEAVSTAQANQGSYHFDMTTTNPDGTTQQVADGSAVFGDGAAPDQGFRNYIPGIDEYASVRILDALVYTDAMSVTLPERLFVAFDAEEDAAIRTVIGPGPHGGDFYAHADVITSLADNADHLTITQGDTSTDTGDGLTEFVIDVDDEVALQFQGDVARPPRDDSDYPFEPLVYRIWVTPDYLPQSIHVGNDSILGDYDLEMRFFDYGESAVVEAPPAEDIISVEEALDRIREQVEQRD